MRPEDIDGEFAWHVIKRAVDVNGQLLRQQIAIATSDLEFTARLRSDIAALDEFYGELYRLLHNYAASVKSLVDHSRDTAEKHFDHECFAEYQARVMAIRDDPACRFVQDLRNVLLHDQLPRLNVSYGWRRSRLGPRGMAQVYVEFDREQLLSIRRFTSGARSYIESKSTEFDVLEPIDEYAELIHDLNDWFANEMSRVPRAPT